MDWNNMTMREFIQLRHDQGITITNGGPLESAEELAAKQAAFEAMMRERDARLTAMAGPRRKPLVKGAPSKYTPEFMAEFGIEG
jgi:hypothetical protein